MRKSTSRTRSRLVAAGISVGAVTAALLIAPSPAYAVDLTSSTPGGGPLGVTVTVTGPFSAPAVGFLLTTAATCPSPYTLTVTAPAISIAGGTPTKVNDTTATFIVPTTATLAKYNICAYNGALPASTLVHAATPTLSFTATPVATTAPGAGNSGGGNSMTVTVPTTAPLNTYNSALFTPKGNSCPGVYGSPSANNVAVITPTVGSTTTGTLTVPIGVSGSLATPTPYTVCVFSSGVAVTTTTALTAAASAPYNVQLPVVSLNTTIGAGGNATPPPNLVVSAPTNFLTGVTDPQALFSVTTCPAVYTATATFISPVLKTANNRAAVTVPTGATVLAGPIYNVCIYNSSSTTTGRLIANATYTAATAPTLLTVSPGGGLAMGGDMITVTGTGFPTNVSLIKATLGGLPLSGIVPVDANTFTAITPMHSAENDVPLVLTTDTGTATKTSAFDYLNAISVSPNTASNTADGTWIDVKGVGFESLAFDTNAYALAADVEARVWLVDATGGACTSVGPPLVCDNTGYLPSGAGGLFTTGPTAECLTPAVISSNELFCKLNLNSGGLVKTTGVAQATAVLKVVPNGTYSLVVVSSGSSDAVAANITQSIISSGSTFTVSDF
jgi:hypothetical protein